MSKISPQGILSFPHLFDPKPRAQGRDPEFSCVLIFNEDQQKTPEYAAMRKAAMEAATDKWGSKAGDMIKQGTVKMPFRDALEKSDQYAGYDEGSTFISPWSKQKPGVVDGRLQDMVPSDVFAGQLVKISYNAFAWDVSGNRGVSIGLNNVQVVNQDMPRLDGKVAASKEFDAIEGGEEVVEGDELPF